MKRFLLSIILATALLQLASCKKNDIPVSQLASVNVINAAVNVPAVKVNYFNNAIVYATYTDSIKYGAGKVYSLASGSTAPLSVVATPDTTKFLWKGNLSLAPGGAYSLYLCGLYPQADTFLVKDNISNYADSLTGVRFINLCFNSSPITINIKGNTAQPEVTGLAYKQITAFKTYAAKSTNTNYIFEVRDAATSTLLFTYTLSFTRFHNHTLLIKGLTGATGTNAPGIAVINNF